MNQPEQQILEAKLTEAPLLAKIERLEAELSAWHSQFGQQLSHAVARRDKLESDLTLAKPPKVCEWVNWASGGSTACGYICQWPPHKFKFCPYCGGEVRVK